MKKMLKTLAISSGTMLERIIRLLEATGLKILRNGRDFNPKIENSDLFSSALFLQPRIIAAELANKKVDAAIFGKDLLEESGQKDKISVVCKLPFAKKTDQPARIVVFGRTSELVDKKKIMVASEYPNLTRRIFKKATVIGIDRGVEPMVKYLGYDYGVCVTETGLSLRDNGLTIVKEIMVSPMVLATGKIIPQLRYFGELLQAALRADRYRLVKMNVGKENLDKILQVLPALESPTISRLATGNFAVESVIPKEDLGNMVIRLKTLGATGILAQSLNLVEL
jgi:ATP phosphoribosyltransferase